MERNEMPRTALALVLASATLLGGAAGRTSGPAAPDWPTASPADQGLDPARLS